MKTYVIYITVSTRREADRLGLALVKERLAACANRMGPIRSSYWWKGRIQRGSEFILIAKTTAAKLKSVMSRVKALHSYEVPCLLAFPISAGNPDFISWICQETSVSVRSSRRSTSAARKRKQ